MNHLNTARSQSRKEVPPRALILSVVALAGPVTASFLMPDWMDGQGAVITWVPAVLPAFLLAYYRGWNGASLGLAATMAALALVQAEILLLGINAPNWGLMLVLVVMLVSVTLGVGAMAELLHRERERAEDQAFTDSLTGIPNRRHAKVFLDAGWAVARRGSGLAVVLFDLDHFKKVNDSHGHAEGDRVIQAFGGVLAERTRRMDISARFGGEEFISVLQNCTIDKAEEFAEEVREGLNAIDFGWGKVTASAGVAVIEKGMGSPDVLVATADQALYVAKEQGRNRVWRSDREGTESFPEPAGDSQPDRGTPIALEDARILVVDDDVDAARAVSRLVGRLGAEVTTAASGREALGRITEGEKFDVIVTDIVMPEMSGFTLVDLASRIKPGLSVLYMSGYPQDEVYWGGTPGARSGFIGKPIEFDQLSPALSRLLGWVDDRATAPAAATPFVWRQGGPHAPTAIPSKGDRGVGRILAVDDDPAIVNAIIRVLVRAGYERPIGVTDPRDVPGIVAKGGIDLLITDMHMPEMNGLELLATLKTVIGPDEYFPVLMLTGDTDQGLRRRALAAGARDFLSKPFDAAEAVARVENLLSARALNKGMAGQRDLLEVLVRERTSELADTKTEILHRLARAAEYRDDITGRHAERVGMLGSMIASELGMSPQEVDLIRRTGPLHDVGKIGVPDAILRKPGRLSQTEFEIMRTHTKIGRQILGGSRHEILECASRIAYSHHERYDGMGYPDGVTGDDIAVEARIVAVADVFDVLSHKRPYKEAFPLGEAVREIVDSSGGHFDPVVVEAFISIYERTGAEEFLSLVDPINPTSDLGDPGD